MTKQDGTISCAEQDALTKEVMKDQRLSSVAEGEWKKAVAAFSHLPFVPATWVGRTNILFANMTLLRVITSLRILQRVIFI
jgi:hypothetical protein